MSEHKISEDMVELTMEAYDEFKIDLGETFYQTLYTTERLNDETDVTPEELEENNNIAVSEEKNPSTGDVDITILALSILVVLVILIFSIKRNKKISKRKL